MIHTSRTVTVGKMESVINEPIMLYRGDREVEIEFNIVGSKFMFSNGGNVIKSTNATNGQLVINTPTGENMFSEVTECNDGKVVCVITKEMIDELAEVGFYSFQIRLFDESQVSRVTIPPVYQGIEIRNPIAAEDETDLVDIGLVDFSVVRKDNYENVVTFLPNGDYNKTLWEEHDVISKDRLNKVEDALYEINKGTEGLYPTFQNQYDEFSAKVDKDVKAYKEEMEDEVEQFERDMTQAFGEFKVDYRDDMYDRMDVVEGELESVNSQLVDIEKHTKVFVNIRDFEQYKVGDDWTEAINKAIEFIYTKDCFELYFPPGTYKVTKPLNSINKIGCICGNDKLDTIIEYTPSSDSTLLSISVNSSINKYFQVKNITLKCSNKDYIVNGLVCSRGAISQNLWGAGISIQDCRVLSFTGVGIKLYAPFMCNLDRVYVAGSGYKSEGDKPVGIKPIGIEFTGNENNLNTFGNVNSISDCMVANCCYGIKLVSVGNVEINTTTFEPNFINLYAYNPKGSDNGGFSDYITLNNCWFENYNNNSHSKYGAICDYEFDESTGDIKQGLSRYKKGVVYLNHTLIHSSISNVNTKVIHAPGGGLLNGSLINDLDQSDTNISIFKYTSHWGNPIDIGTKSNYLHASTMFGKGTRRTYSNKIQGWLAGKEASYYLEKNISNPISAQVYTADFVVPTEFEKPEQLDVKALISIGIGGGNMMYVESECKIFNLSNIVVNTNKTTVLYNPWGDLKEIESGFIGSMISYDKNTKTITFNIKSSMTYTIQINLELNASYLESQIK